MPRRRSSAKTGPSQRQLRIGELLRHALSDIFIRGEIRDPDLKGISITVTEVKPTPDMRYATVYCEPLGGGDASKIVAALNRHKAYLRGEMGHAVELRYTPELRFAEDTSFAEAEHIENILKSPAVARDLGPEETAEDDEFNAETDEDHQED